MKDQESRGTEKHCWGETPGEEEISGQMNPGAGWGGGTGALAVRGHWEEQDPLASGTRSVHRHGLQAEGTRSEQSCPCC